MREDIFKEMSKALTEFEEAVDELERNWCDNTIEYRYHVYKLRKLVIKNGNT